MKLGIMQPYFFPYIGYFQLINAVDKYVLYDDVNFIKGGWINRNRILVNGEDKYINEPMLGASPNKLINEVNVNTNEALVNKNIRMLENAYRKAPYFNEIYALISDILHYDCNNIAEFNYNAISKVCKYLGINTEIIISSHINKDNSLRAEEKVIAICKALHADEYINTSSGMELYSFDNFMNNNIKLYFLKSGNIKYKQFNNEFIPNLSIIDVMMFNSKDEISVFLNDYILIDK